MSVCEKLDNCAFVGCCDQYEKSTAAKGFISMYCKGSKMNACIRKKLAGAYGKEIVPKNMMPNGAPLPEQHKLIGMNTRFISDATYKTTLCIS